jgi:hypothetical protein
LLKANGGGEIKALIVVLLGGVFYDYGVNYLSSFA